MSSLDASGRAQYREMNKITSRHFSLVLAARRRHIDPSRVHTGEEKWGKVVDSHIGQSVRSDKSSSLHFTSGGSVSLALQ